MTSNLDEKTVDLDAALASLGESIDRSNAEKDRLRERLRLITRAALNYIDGDSQPHDTRYSEIVGIAQGDPNWLRHAKINYDVDHAKLVTLCRKLFDGITDQVNYESGADAIAHYMADQLEQEILPEMFLAEDGRVFLRGRGKPYPPDDDACPRCGSTNVQRVPDGIHPENGDKEICGDCGR